VPALLLLLLVSSGRPAAAGAPPQSGQISLESLYSPDPDARVDYSGTPPAGLAWVDENHYIERRADAWMRVDAVSGDAEPAVDTARLRARLALLPGLTDVDVAAMTRSAARGLARGRDAVLLNHANDLFVVFADGRAQRLTFDADPEVGEELSPDGRFVSFVRNYNLHLIEIESGRERSLTVDGSPEMFYGRLDWVYQEEVYGRGNFKGYWWSPNSSAIVFLKLDE